MGSQSRNWPHSDWTVTTLDDVPLLVITCADNLGFRKVRYAHTFFVFCEI